MPNKFQPNSPMDPYDSASIRPTDNEQLDDLLVSARMSNNPALSRVAQELMADPVKFGAMMKMMEEDAKERERTSETMEHMMRREKEEWARQAAKAVNIKEEGNAALRSGDVKRAYILYTACMKLAPQEPVYVLNRSQAGLQLRLFNSAERDADAAEMDDPGNSKALFRRGKARRMLGKLEEAKKDLQRVHESEPSSELVLHELAEVGLLESKSADELAQWAKEQSVEPREVFEGAEEEVSREAESILESVGEGKKAGKAKATDGAEGNEGANDLGEGGSA